MPTETVEAELWSEVPQQAAPPAPSFPQEITPPQPVLPPTPAPQPIAAPIPAPPTKAIPDPAIALAKEKARKEKLAKEAREAKEREAKEAAEQKATKEKERKLAEQKEKEKKAKDAKDAAALDDLIQKKTKAAAEKEKKQREAAAAEAENRKILDSFRNDQIKRMSAESGNGDAGSTGTAKQSSGPSASYAGRIRARIKPNITYTETISGNPVAEVLVHIAADGTILNRRLTKSSGVKSWDNAVLNAIDKTEVLPTDVDGRVQSEMVISFRPKD